MIRRLAWLAGPARRNRGWRAYLRRIRRVASLDAAGFAAWRDEAVAEHLRWARREVPFFREHAPASDRLADWPVLRRADVQAHAEALCNDQRAADDLIENASGGSTGEPVRIWQDAAYWATEFANEVWLWRWWGLPPWCAKAYLWGDDLAVHEKPWKERLEERLLGLHALNVFDVGAGELEAFTKRMERVRPPVLLGYASALALFADHVQARGGTSWRPQLVRSAAEALRPEVRQHVEAALGVRVTDVYGSRESASLAAEWHDGHFYTIAHGRILEIVDDTGRPLPPGEPGRVLVTDLTNRAFGLIRYENGDVSAWADTPPPDDPACPYPRVARIHGRTSDFITTPEGVRIHGEWFTHLFYGVPEVTRFQVRQPEASRVHLLTEGPAGEDVVGPKLAAMRERLGPSVEVTWEAVDAIPLTKTGKWRFTVSDVPFRAGTP